MDLPYTSLLTGVFAVMMVMLALQVSLRRRQAGISLGDGEDDLLRRRIRAHGNFAEHVPLGLIAVGLVELSSAPDMLVIGLAAALLFSRVIHATGIVYFHTAAPRVLAMVLQHSAYLIAAWWLIFK